MSRRVENKMKNYQSLTTQNIYTLLEAWSSASTQFSKELTVVRDQIFSVNDNAALLYGD